MKTPKNPGRRPTQIPFTQATYDQLKKDLDLLEEKRVQTVARLQTAREMGDLSENGAYKYAKQELGDIDRRMRNLRYQIQNGYVPIIVTTGTVGFGSTVTLKARDKTLTFMLVSKHESDPSLAKLSTDSPIGRAVYGKSIDDVVSVDSPRGITMYTIVAIK